jgi:hypothetical protein
VKRNTEGRERMLYLMSSCILLDIQWREVIRNTEGREGMLYLVYPAGYPVEGGDEEHRGKGGDEEHRGKEGMLYLVYPAGYCGGS